MGRYPAESLSVVVSQKIIAPINEQIGNEFSAMLQYYATAAHFSAEALPGLAAHFNSQAEEESSTRCGSSSSLPTPARV
jgi:Ferritin-like domain